MKTLHKYENLTYLGLWGILFIGPVLSLSIRTAADAQATFNWSEVFLVWCELAIYLVLFLIHNYLLAPLLIYKQNRWGYFASLAVVVILFGLVQCMNRPADMGPGAPPPHEATEAHGANKPYEPYKPYEAHEPYKAHEPHKPHEPHKAHKPPIFRGEHDIIATIVLVLMFGMNLGVKLYFKQRRDQRVMGELEKQNLEKQLEYLRYQINPHFLMNTLNNIHALVDIDPEEAKHTILELSRMMRFVLYEGNKKTVPLSSELNFLEHYISLMSLRYTDKVDINVSLPQGVEGGDVPPLLFVTFVENAFKHGISYQQESFVEVKATLEHHVLVFSCRNSKRKEERGERKEERGERKEGGVGLKNVRERLNLIYGSQYSLDISETDVEYSVRLVIPIKSKIENP